MESDPLSFKNNRFLYTLTTSGYVTHEQKKTYSSLNICTAFCFIDDLAAINESREFVKILHKIDNLELELPTLEACFLDLNIKSLEQNLG